MPIILKNLIISYFKSFEGRVEITPFPKLVAIIGPNGCGKSNIMDAMRFALGEKPNALRVDHLSELIYKSDVESKNSIRSKGQSVLRKSPSEKKSPIEEEVSQIGTNSTYVKIVFMGDNNEEKSFMRMIHEDGKESIYNIDSENVTCNIYMTELKKIGLDVKLGTFLVPQDNTECFAVQSPKKRTLTFEMISGSDEYKTDYTRLMKENERLKEKIHNTFHKKQQLLIQQKCATAEAKEAEMYFELQEQYIKKKKDFRLVQILLMKNSIQTFQNKEMKKKLQVEQCSNNRKEIMLLYEQHKSQFMLLEKSLKAIEEDIQTSENVFCNYKKEHVKFAEKILHCQKNYNYAHARLNEANKAHEVNIRIVQELKDKLEEIQNQLNERRGASSFASVNLTDSQVNLYWNLKHKAEWQVKDLIKQMRDQEADRNKFENENLIQQKLNDKLKQATSIKDRLKKDQIRLENLKKKFEETLENKIAEKENLIKKINEAEKNKSEIQKISEELDQNYDFANITLQEKKKMNIIKNLKRFSGVYDRLSQLCKPIDSRYNVPMIQVFGKYMEAIVVNNINTAKQCIQYLKQQELGFETFLPLDSIKPVRLMERLRDITEPKNVKLLFDVLSVTSAQIAHAVLFVTKNTLVCETAEDARRLAYEIDKPNTYDCVSLDGCFYRKNGLFSGGLENLNLKAKNLQKKWKEIDLLKKRKEELKVKLPNISEMQSDLNTLQTEIKARLLDVENIQQNIRDCKSEIEENDVILQKLTRQLSLSSSTISEMQPRMQKLDKNIDSIQENIDAIEHEIFADFCNDNDISHISTYENQLQVYKNEKKKLMNLEEQYNRIEDQLHQESGIRKQDTEDKILKWTRALERADTELNDAHQQKTLINSKMQQEKTNLSKLEVQRAQIEEYLKDIDTKLTRYESQDREIIKLQFKHLKEHIAIQKQIEQKKAECNAVLKECKMEDIPILTGMLRSESSTSSSTSMSIELSNDLLEKIDFSSIRNNSEEDLENSIVQLDETLTKIQDQIKAIVNPNLKINREKIKSMAKEIINLNETLKILRKEIRKVEKALNEVKEKRNKKFSNCLECVAAAVNPIYKDLVKERSVKETLIEAVLVSDNLEELYAGGLHYSCIPPYKRFQPISNLSGGEKSLANLALQFAIQRYKPAPFFFMDEGDAALDKTNSQKLIRFIQSHFTKDDTKVIIITLQKSLFSHFDVLIGVAADPDVERFTSKIFSISLENFNRNLTSK